MPAPRLLLLDTASLYFRAFYGVPDSMKAPDGTVVNAVRGLLDFVSTLSAQYSPDAVVAAWDDDWRPQWRVDLIPSYKAHRVEQVSPGDDPDVEEVPDLLSPQVPLIAEALGIVGIPVLGRPGAEADDVIGTLAGRATGGADVVTGDRDLFQLVDDDRSVRVLYTARGVGRHDVVDDAWVHAKYGVHADRYVDFSVMRGDTSDGLPGVAGIGEKTAATLLAEFGDLAGIRAAAKDPGSSLKPRARQSLLDSADYLDAAVEVVTVRPDLDLPEIEARTPLTEAQKDELAAFGERWGLGGAPGRLVDALG